MVLKRDKFDILETEIKNELRDYVKKTDWVVKEDPLGFIKLLGDGYPHEKGKRKEEVDRGMREKCKRLSTLITLYKNGTLGEICNDIANHDDFDLLELYNSYVIHNGSAIGHIQTLWLEYIERSFGHSPGVQFAPGNVIFKVKKTEDTYEAVYCSNRDFKDTLMVENLKDILHNLKIGVFVHSKQCTEVNRAFFSKYKVLGYKKAIEVELGGVRNIYRTIIANCNQIPRLVTETIEEGINTIEYLFVDFIEKDDRLIQPSIIRNLLSYMSSIITYAYMYKDLTGKHYNRVVGEYTIIAPTVNEMVARANNLESILQNID